MGLFFPAMLMAANELDLPSLMARVSQHRFFLLLSTAYAQVIERVTKAVSKQAFHRAAVSACLLSISAVECQCFVWLCVMW
jgi:hypothetical protein